MIRILTPSVLLPLGLVACGGSISEVVMSEADTRQRVADNDAELLETLAAEVTESNAIAPEQPATFLPPEAETAAGGLGAVSYDLPACPDSPRGAVTDKANQRYWLCMDGAAVTDAVPMTTASSNYGLPPVGTYEVFARDEDAVGIDGEALERFVAFYTTPNGNRIAFHEVVNQDPDTVGDLDQRGASAGCFRVRESDSVQLWEFLQVGDPVVVLTN